MEGEVRLFLRGRLDHLRMAVQAIEAFLADVPFEEDPEQNRYNVVLAAQEMVSNVLRHAYSGAPGQPLEIRLSFRDGCLELVVLDEGAPFNPTSFPAPRSEGAENGGFGIHIARTVMDEVHYHRRANRNVLTLRKLVRHRTEAPPAGAR